MDEYQDTNRPQYLLVRRLAEIHRNLCVVGDPDQSIYKWRGADLRNILDFEQDFPDVQRRQARAELPIDAGHSRRGVGGHPPQPQPQDKRLWTDQRGGELIRYVRAARRDRGSRLHHAAPSARPSAPIATAWSRSCIGPTRSRARLKTRSCATASPYRIIGGVRFYERKEIKDALSYLRLVINPHDDVSFRRVVNVPARGIGKTVLEALDAVDPGTADADTPLFAAGLEPGRRRRDRMWARLVVADRPQAGPAASRGGAHGLPRHHRRARRRCAGRERVDRARTRARSIRLPARRCARSGARTPRRASKT